MSNNVMGKADLVKEIVKNNSYNISQKCAAEMIDAMTNAITAQLKKGGKVQLLGFGTFSTSKRAARKGRNPLTGEEMRISAKTLPKLKFSSSVRDILNPSSAKKAAKPAAKKTAAKKPAKTSAKKK